jgi:hypothetical protein
VQLVDPAKDQEPILWSSVSAENFLDKLPTYVQALNFGQTFTTEIYP